MALFEEQITEKLESGAPPITYEGNEGKEQQIARELWDQLPPEAQQQFGSFQQFFSSGAWKEVIAQLQQAQAQQAQSQEGLGSMMPAQMADGGILQASYGYDDAMGESWEEYKRLQKKGVIPIEMEFEEFLGLQQEGGFMEMASGGIAGAHGGRPGYFLGKLVKKITKPIKKIVKSPVGKAAVLYGLGTLAGGMPAFGGAGGSFMSKLANPGNLLNLVRPGGWSQTNWLNPLVRKSKDIVKAGETIKEWGDPSWAKILGAGATVAPFAMQAAGKWDTGAEEIDNLKLKAAEFGFDYNQMIQDLQTAVATGSEAELAKVLSNYNLSRGDMSAAPYIGTAAEGGRIGYKDAGPVGVESIPVDQMEAIKGQTAGPAGYHRILEEQMSLLAEELDKHPSDLSDSEYELAGNRAMEIWRSGGFAQGGRIGYAEGGLMSLGGNEMDLRGGGFVPIGAKEKADDVPARLSKNEFVFTADAVRAAGGGDVDAGADKMYKTMKQLENRIG